MNTRRWLFAIWLCFIVRVAFYSAALPLWEGYDEWSHFAVIRYVALQGVALPSREAPVPKDVELSLGIAPVAWELRNLPPPSVTHDAFWMLPPEERERRVAAFRDIPHAWSATSGSGMLKAYEALQPPLYAWVMSPASWLMRDRPLPDQVLVLRWLSCVIASLTIPLVFRLGRIVFNDDAMALGISALVAVMPEFALDVARVGNECVAVPLFTLLTCMIAAIPRAGLRRNGATAIGCTLGLGLLAKAYFLTAIPAIAVVYLRELWIARRSGRAGQLRSSVVSMLLSALLAVAIAGWWYARNLIATGTVSGLNEAVMLKGVSQQGLLSRAAQVHWMGAIDSILLSHIWFGAWSSLTVRSWIYHVFFAIAALGAIGVLRAFRKLPVWPIAVLYGAFWLGQLYNVLLLFASKGASTSMGWYMYAVVGAEVALCAAGLLSLSPARFRQWTLPAGVLLFVLLDLYTVNAVLLPYYTGMIAHKSNGHLAALHWSDFAGLGLPGEFARLAVFKPSFAPETVLVALFTAYFVATVFLSISSFIWIRRCKSESAAIGSAARSTRPVSSRLGASA